MLIIYVLCFFDSLPFVDQPFLNILHVLHLVLRSFHFQLGQFVIFELDLLEVELRNCIQIEQVDIVNEPAQLHPQCFYVGSLGYVLHDLVGLVQGVVLRVLPEYCLELFGSLPGDVVGRQRRNNLQYDVHFLFCSFIQQLIGNPISAVVLTVNHTIRLALRTDVTLDELDVARCAPPSHKSDELGFVHQFESAIEPPYQTDLISIVILVLHQRIHHKPIVLMYSQITEAFLFFRTAWFEDRQDRLQVLFVNLLEVDVLNYA